MKPLDRDRDLKLVVSLLTGELTRDEFELSFNGSTRSRSLHWLTNGVEGEDAIAAELGLLLGHRFGFIEACVPVLIRLATSDWHQCHESVVDALAELRAPESVDTLFETATRAIEYRDYDDAQSLPVKCVWALMRIDTVHAVARLGEVRDLGDAVVAEAARSALDRLTSGSLSDVVRDAARSAMSSER